MTTRPSMVPPQQTSPNARSLRRRWRMTMFWGINVLVLLVAGSAALIMGLEQRRAIIRQYDTAARLVENGTRQVVGDVQQTLALAALIAPDEGIEAEALLGAHPALRWASRVEGDGTERWHVPSDSTWTPPDWTTHPVWAQVAGGERYAAFDPAYPDLYLVAVPAADGLLVAALEPGPLWTHILDGATVHGGYAYLMRADGLLLATAPDQPRDANRDPGTFAAFEAAQNDNSATRVYRGLSGKWVIGRAVTRAGDGYTVVVEMPLSEFAVPFVRIVLLMLLALALAAVVGEWLIRRMLRTVLGPVGVLQAGARAAVSGDYGYRVRFGAHTGAELVELGQAFNTLIERLGENQRQLDASAQEMQELIDRRARELSRKAQKLETVADLSEEIGTILNPRALIDAVTERLKRHFHVYHAAIWLLDGETGEIRRAAGRAPVDEPACHLQDANSHVVAWVARHERTLYLPSVNGDPRYRPAPDRPATQCVLALPLKVNHDLIGVLHLETEHREAFTPDDIDVLAALADDIAVAVRNAQTFEGLETANRDLAQAMLQAKQADTLKSRFVLNVGHRLREPLDAILSTSETLLSGVYGELPERIREQQQHIIEQGRALQALIEDMIDLASIEAGFLQLNLEWVAVTPLLDELMNAAQALHQTAYPDHDLVLRLDLDHLDEPLPPVWGDVDRLRYILFNLVSNAVKYTEAGEVVLSADCDETTVRIHVRDTGPGIGGEALRYLFEPFQHRRGESPAMAAGTGLGLPVSRLLAMRLGGDLSVDSVLGEGSTFTLNLPRRPEGAPPPPDA